MSQHTLTSSKVVALFPERGDDSASPQTQPTPALGDALLSLLGGGQVVVDDAQLVAALLADRVAAWAPQDVRVAIDDLVSAGALRRMMILDRVHIGRAEPRPAPQPARGPAPQPARRRATTRALEAAHPRFSEDVHAQPTQPALQAYQGSDAATEASWVPVGPDVSWQAGPTAGWNNPPAPTVNVLPVMVAPPAAPVVAAAAATASAEEEDIFRLELELDTEHERLLLLRVVLVIEILGGLLLGREWLLWALT